MGLAVILHNIMGPKATGRHIMRCTALQAARSALSVTLYVYIMDASADGPALLALLQSAYPMRCHWEKLPSSQLHHEDVSKLCTIKKRRTCIWCHHMCSTQRGETGAENAPLPGVLHAEPQVHWQRNHVITALRICDRASYMYSGAAKG